MKIKGLKALLASLPDGTDDIDVHIELDTNGESNGIENISHSVWTNFKGKKILALIEKVVSDVDAAVFDKQLRLGIPDEFIEFCEDNHTSPREVLHGFIADLLALDNYVSNPRADHLGRNGSDECDLAEEYFRRVGYQYRDGE